MEQLTRREGEVLQAMADGCTIGEAAHRLGLRYGTAHNYLASARARLDARSTAQACCILVSREVADKLG